MTTKTIVYIGIGAVVVLGSLYIYKTQFAFDKSKTVDELLKGGWTSQPKSALMTWQDGFLKAWLKASKSGQGRFTFEGKYYATQGGKAVK